MDKKTKTSKTGLKEGYKRVSVDLTEHLYKRLTSRANKAGKSRKAYSEEVILNHLKTKE